MPAWIEPQLAVFVKAAPNGDAWLHEIKLDGYRMDARLGAGSVRLLTSRGNQLGRPPETVRRFGSSRPA
jgi:bifunctional non-homologous end joining protein LigD